MTTKITGHVAEIISDRELILNRGSADGVERGMYFDILDKKTLSIKDPISGEELGGINRVKLSVIAVEVTDRMTLVETYRTKTVNIGGHGPDMSMLAGITRPPKYVEQVETLRYAEDSPRPITDEESMIAIGDAFEQSERQDGVPSSTARIT